MTERIQGALAGGGADSRRRPAEPPAPAARRRRTTEPAVRLTPDEALARLRAAARDAGQDVQFALEAVDGESMVVTMRADGTVLRSVPLHEALRLAAALCGTAGGLFEGSL
jgi:uncharacterized FlaG/YvyC family protein